ncbi:hypothetical protein HYFRA_00001821 [Hymenoscyphus fraxineus]|uniref:Uncharacterized protein n=1 Tax=Hymenoscyphus fraxineus TaxID=746836 RepID=A0A9N9KJG9_9HELO|nr:hypothetical protein HYFRA_00001821 [Hymenoscyphus fraxineus]
MAKPTTKPLLPAFPPANSLPSPNTKAILPTTYHDYRDNLIRPNTNHKGFVSHDLSVSRLNKLHEYLWLAGQSKSARPLHRQKSMGREIIITEQADLHLVWDGSKIFVKPLPDYLLSHKFWDNTICQDSELYESACGFLLSYIWLISHMSDLRLAKELGLVSPQINWKKWTSFAGASLDNIDALTLDTCNKRYQFGELRLGRLNFIHRLVHLSEPHEIVRGYMYQYTSYSYFFGRNFKWVLLVFVYLSIILTAMQVGLATDQLQLDERFQNATFGFVVFSIVAPVAIVGISVLLFFCFFLYHFILTRFLLKARELRRRQAVLLKVGQVPYDKVASFISKLLVRRDISWETHAKTTGADVKPRNRGEGGENDLPRFPFFHLPHELKVVVFEIQFMSMARRKQAAAACADLQLIHLITSGGNVVLKVTCYNLQLPLMVPDYQFPSSTGAREPVPGRLNYFTLAKAVLRRMKMVTSRFSKVAGLLLVFGIAIASAEVATWCGKPYMSTDQAVDPGGQFQFPEIKDTPMLQITLQPLYSIFLENDIGNAFILNAEISYTFGQPFVNSTHTFTEDDVERSRSFNRLEFEIFSDEDTKTLVSSSIRVNTTANLIYFSLSSFTPRLSPYPITLHGKSPDGKQKYTAKTSIYVLPSRTSGSAVKIDNLHGGLLVQNLKNLYTGWYTIFPHGHYADGGHVTPAVFNLTNLNTYAELGFNTINIVPDGGLPDQSYPVESLAKYWDRMDELNLLNIYDMRFAFQNSTRIEEQVALWKDRESLLMWYTADEPDGWAYPLNSTLTAFTHLQTLDPYHPVSLVLNCQNYHYIPYSSGAQIILTDPYPISINATYSLQFNTPCNETYGDCGCDNCLGSISDVPTRITTLQTYESNLPNSGRKPLWAILQAFGNQSYWPGYPTSEEVAAMAILSLNAGVKGLGYWIYPSSPSINSLTGKLGRVLDSPEVRDRFLFGPPPVKVAATGNGSGELDVDVDVGAWIRGDKVLLGIVNAGAAMERLEISLPEEMGIRGVGEVLFGEEGWGVEGGRVVKDAFGGLEVALLVLDLE